MTLMNRKLCFMVFSLCLAACANGNPGSASAPPPRVTVSPLGLLHEAEPPVSAIRSAIVDRLQAVQGAPGSNAAVQSGEKIRAISVEKTSEHIASGDASLAPGDTAQIQYQFSMVETDATQEVSLEGTVVANFVYDGTRFNASQALAVEDTRFGVTDVMFGSVTDCQTGVPLYKATIHIAFRDGHEKRIFTDQLGQYTIRAVKGEQITVTAWLEGYVAENVYTYVPDQVDFTLCHEALPDPILPQVQVTVRDADGQTIEGATVSLGAANSLVALAFTNALGSHLFSSVPMTADAVFASKAGKNTTATLALTSSFVAVDLMLPNHAPSCSLSPSTSSVLVSATDMISVLGFDQDGDSLTFEFSAMAGAVTGGSANLLYSAPGVPGTYSVQGRVSDGISSATCSTPIHVVAQPAVPPPAPSRTVTSIAGGTLHTCAITDEKNVWCWGDNAYGQLGNRSLLASSLPVTVASLGNIGQIETGAYHTCALSLGGAVSCWGMNTWGQLGNNSYVNSNVPVQVVGLTSGVREIAIGAGFGCALKDSDGSVVCWGLNNYGQIGNNSYNPSSGPAIPTQVINPDLSVFKGVDSLSASGQSVCAIKGGAVICWGVNLTGQLGIETATGPEHCDPPYGPVRFCSKTPVATVVTQDVVSLSAGQYSYCALLSNGSVKCWGDNRSSQLAHGADLETCDVQSYGLIPCGIVVRTAELVPGSPLTGVIEMMTGMGNGFFCGRTSDGVICWGGISYSLLGDGVTVVAPTLMTLATPGISKLSAGYYHVCGITPDGKPECWGRNYSGELGVGDTAAHSSPRRVRGF